VNHATKWEDFTSALTEFADPPQIFVYADRWGNTGCQAAGMIPKRTNNTQGTMLGVGSDTSAKWDGFVPFEKLPQAFLPANSTTLGANLPAIAANQRPSSGTAIPKAPQSLILGHQWNAPYRANRLLAAITGAKAPISVGDINSLQGDEFSPISAVLAKSLQQSAIATQYIDSDGLKIIDKMLRWNGQLQAGSTEASVQEAFLQVFQRRLLEPMLGREMATEYLQRWQMWTPLAESIIRDKPAGWMPPEERSYDTFFLTTLTQAMKSLKITFAESDQRKWSWGTIHSAFFRHISPNATPLFRSFALGPVPVGGTVDTLNSSDVYVDPYLLRYNAESGPTQRMIVDMADRDKFYQSLATGQSGHRFSPHHDDQLNAWRKVDLAPVAFSPDQLIRQSKHRLQLESKYGQ
jgi:penicillin amidase